MKKQILLNVLLIFLLAAGCRQDIKEKNDTLMHIERVSLREGVFERRYMLTQDYGKNSVITSKILKDYIGQNLEPDYLLVEDAYSKGIDQIPSIHQKIMDYRINLIAGNHPFNTEKLTISKSELQDYYHKKAEAFDIDIVQANAFPMADSIYAFLQSGKKLQRPKDEMANIGYPKHFHFSEVTAGNMLHPDMYAALIKMEAGQFTRPIFIAPTWNVVLLNGKLKNSKLKPFDKIEAELINEIQAQLKFEKQNQLFSSLKEKYKVSVERQFLDNLSLKFKMAGPACLINETQVEQTELNKPFITIGTQVITLSSFISSFNDAFAYMQAASLAKPDLEMFMDTYINQNLLYHDAIDKGVDQAVIIQDQLQNKEHKILLSYYLKNEIEQKVTVTEDEARKYYEQHRDKWTGEFKNVAPGILFELKTQRIKNYIAEHTQKLRGTYTISYNEELLEKLAGKLTKDKPKT